MGFRLEHGEALGQGLRRVAAERLDDAVERLDGLADLDPTETEAAVHAVRKRAKEVRGLLRLARPSLGAEFGRANRSLRDAAAELASLRDAQALALTFTDLRRAEGDVRRPPSGARRPPAGAGRTGGGGRRGRGRRR